MLFGLMMLSKRSWPIWLAVRSVVTAAVCIVLACILHKSAIPALVSKGQLDKFNVPAMTQLVIENHQWLPWIPVPALVLAFAAVILRPLRKILAPLAALASLLAVIVVIGSLIVVMMPMYSTVDLFDQ